MGRWTATACLLALGLLIAVPVSAADGDDGRGLTPRLDATLGSFLANVGIAMVLGAFAFWYLVLPRGFRKGHEEILERYGFIGAWMQMVGLFVLGWAEVHRSGLGLVDHFVGTTPGRGLLIRLILAFVLLSWFSQTVRKEEVPRAAWGSIAGVTLVTIMVAGMFDAPLLWGALTVLHLLAVGAWVGGLGAYLLFLKALPEERPDLEAHLQVVPKRFSDMVAGSILLAFATGSLLAWSAGRLEPIAWTGDLYGRLLAAKVGLALLMVLLTILGRVRYLPRYQRGGGAKTLESFRDKVQLEVALGVLVFLLAAVIASL